MTTSPIADDDSRQRVQGPGPLFGAESNYFTFVREERQLCAILAHLLLSRGDNLRRFVRLLNEQLKKADLPEYLDPARADPDGLELYLEFAFLRDYWSRFDLSSSVGEANRRKREFLLDLFARTAALRGVPVADLPPSIGEFNACFIGPAGAKWRTFIGSPGNWRVPALLELARRREPADLERQRTLFLGLCRFKWAFNIQADLVMLLPGARPLCVEAKLLSPPSVYPATSTECRLFDQVYGPQQGRSGQIEMQKYLFRELLGNPAQQLVIARDPADPLVTGVGGTTTRIPVLDWTTVLAALDRGNSVPFVARLAEGNRIVQRGAGDQLGSAMRRWDGQVTGLAAIVTLVQQRQAQGAPTQVGYQVGTRGGADLLEQATLDALEARRWKWRDPRHHPSGAFWIDGPRFVDIVERLREEAAG